jgi:hypothetical protein
MFVVFCCLGFVAANRPRKYRAGPTGLDRSKKRSDRLNHLSVCLSFDVCCFTCCVSLLIIVVVRVAVVADDILAILWCFKHQLLLAQILDDFSYSIYIYTYTKKSGWSLPGQPKCIRQVPPPVATFWREQTASTSFTTHKVIKYQFSLQHVVCSEWQRWQQPTTTTTAGNGLGMFPKDVSLWLIDDFTPIQPCLLLIPTNGMVLCHWTFTCLKDIK